MARGGGAPRGYSEGVAVCAGISFFAVGAGDWAGIASAIGRADGRGTEIDVAIAAGGAAGEGGALGEGGGKEDTRGVWTGGGAHFDSARYGVASFGSAGRARAHGADAIDEGWTGNRSARGGDNRNVSDRRDDGGAGISGGAIAGDGGFGAVDRGQVTAGARAGGARAHGGVGPDGGQRVAQFAESFEFYENGTASTAGKSGFTPGCAARLYINRGRD